VARQRTAYRGEDRRRTARGADESLGWIVAGAAVLTTVGLLALAWSLADLPTWEALASPLAILLLQAATATGAAFVALLLLRRAGITGEAAPRLIAAATVALALGTLLAELPAALGPLLTGFFALRVASMLVAVGFLVAAQRWPTIDAGLRSSAVALVGLLAGLAAAVVILLVLVVAPTATARTVINVVVNAGVVVAAATLIATALRQRRRLFAAAALLLLAWGITQLLLSGPLPGNELAAVFEGLRLAAVVLVVLAALDDLAATFDAQRSVLMRTELDRRSVEEELVAERRLAEERAHEARSALAAIEGASSMLGRYRQTLDADGQVALTEAIRAEIRRLQRLVEDPAAALDPEPLDLAVLACREAELAARQGSTVRNLLDEGPMAYADAHTMGGIVRNLLVNARVHAPGATVTLTTREVDDGDQVALVVADDGPGLPAGQHEAVFERGQRGAASTDRPGSGLGLHVARALAERNGGALWAEDTPGGGATFVLTLPALDDQKLADDAQDDATGGEDEVARRAPEPEPAAGSER